MIRAQRNLSTWCLLVSLNFMKQLVVLSENCSGGAKQFWTWNRGKLANPLGSDPRLAYNHERHDYDETSKPHHPGDLYTSTTWHFRQSGRQDNVSHVFCIQFGTRVFFFWKRFDFGSRTSQMRPQVLEVR